MIGRQTASLPGAAARSIDIANAIQNAGLVWRPWRGGPEPARLVQSEGLPLLATVRAATIARGHLIPGGSSLMRAAKLETLGLGDPVAVPTAAAFIASLAGDDSGQAACCRAR